MSTKNNKLRFIDEEKTKELQKDWKGYGKSQVLFGIVVFVIFVLKILLVLQSKFRCHLNFIAIQGEELKFVKFCRA